MDTKVVLPIHAFVHHKLQLDGCFRTRLECRRTDDGARRSAPLYDFDDGFPIEDKHLVTYILDPKDRLDCCAQFDIAVIESWLVNGSTWLASYFGCGSDGCLLPLGKPDHQRNHSQCGYAKHRRQPLGSGRFL